MRPSRLALRPRVAAGFALLGIAVSLALGGWLYLASLDLEQRLIDESIGAEVQDYLARLSRDPRSLPPQTAALRGWIERSGKIPKADDNPVPPGLRGLTPGLHTLDLDGVGYRAAVYRGADVTLYMLHSQGQLARRNRQLAWALLVGIGLSAVLSASVGWWLAGQVTAPVRALAERVRAREPSDPVSVDGAEFPEDEVGELARTIDGYLTRIRAFLERERSFVNGVSHELRTPLAIIQGAVEVLESDPDLKPHTRERVERIARSARGMSDLAQALLVLAREGQSDHATPCAVDEVLGECVEQQRPLLRHKPVELLVRVQAHPVLEVPEPLLVVALGNLLRNACTYTESGRIEVTLSDSEVRVEDTGPGIPPDLIGCLFDQDASRRRTVRGAGIGLPLVKRIADGQGWSVAVESSPGQGACFRLRFASESPLGPAAVPD